MTYLHKPVPPPLAVPFPSLQEVNFVVDLVFVEKQRPTEREYDKKRVIVEEVDKGTR